MIGHIVFTKPLLKWGNSHVIVVPAHYVKAGVLYLDKLYDIEVKEADSGE